MQLAKCLALRMTLLRLLEALRLNREYWFQLPKFLSSMRHSRIHVKHGWSVWNTTGPPMLPTRFSGKANLKSFAGPSLTFIHWLTGSSSPGSEIWFRNSLQYYSKSWPTSKSIFPSQAILLSYLYSLNIHSFSALAFLYFYLCLRLHKLKQSHTFKQTEKG